MDPEELHAELTLLRDLGFSHLDLGVPATESVDGQRTPQRVGDSEVRETTDSYQSVEKKVFTPAVSQILPAITAIAAATEDWESFTALAKQCTRCKLSASRTQVVVGSGNTNAELMFIGEAPGRDEDLAGEPFVGRAGQLLTDILKAMHLSREQVYIANVIKCRPPENRNPEADELEACRPYIKQQIEMVNPKVIVTLGKFALQSMVNQTLTISAVRGEWQSYGNIRLMPTYHPAYLLRTPSAKKDVWNDMKKVMLELGIAF